MYEILPHLYLSNYEDVKKIPPERDIFVINCTKDLDMIKTQGGGTRLYVDDDPSSEQTMTENIPLMLRYIDDHITREKDVVVHCFAGQQRSAAVVATYLVQMKGFTINQAVDFIKSKKSDAFLDGVHFMNSIKVLFPDKTN